MASKATNPTLYFMCSFIFFVLFVFSFVKEDMVSSIFNAVLTAATLGLGLVKRKKLKAV